MLTLSERILIVENCPNGESYFREIIWTKSCCVKVKKDFCRKIIYIKKQRFLQACRVSNLLIAKLVKSCLIALNLKSNRLQLGNQIYSIKTGKRFTYDEFSISDQNNRFSLLLNHCCLITRMFWKISLLLVLVYIIIKKGEKKTYLPLFGFCLSHKETIFYD